MAEDTSNTGGDEAATDTSNSEEAAEGTVSDETGGVTQDEIDAALGPKYKTVAPEAKDEKDADKESAVDDTQDEEGDDDSGDDAGDTGDSSDEAGVSGDDKPADSAKTEVASDEPDFSFEVKDANDVTFKIAPGDSVEDILKDFEPTNNGQIIAVLDQLREAKDNQAKYKAEQENKAAEAETTQRIADIQKGWEAEIKSLQADKRIPTTAKGVDNERVAEVYQFMSEENDKRIAAGRPTIASFEDAFDKLENREAREAKVRAEKDAKDTARKNGGLVGGSSAPASNSVPVYKAGSASNSTQALRAMNLI